MKRTVAVGVLALTACFASDESVGLPELELAFPATAKPGSVQQMNLTVTNPGPEPMRTVVVTFTRVGSDPPLVDGAAHRRNPAIVSIEPQPLTVDRAAVVYQFEGLGDGESRTITFRLRMPLTRGVTANSVQVSDGSNLRPPRGLRLETKVQG